MAQQQLSPQLPPQVSGPAPPSLPPAPVIVSGFARCVQLFKDCNNSGRSVATCISTFKNCQAIQSGSQSPGQAPASTDTSGGCPISAQFAQLHPNVFSKAVLWMCQHHLLADMDPAAVAPSQQPSYEGIPGQAPASPYTGPTPAPGQSTADAITSNLFGLSKYVLGNLAALLVVLVGVYLLFSPEIEDLNLPARAAKGLK